MLSMSCLLPSAMDIDVWECGYWPWLCVYALLNQINWLEMRWEYTVHYKQTCNIVTRAYIARCMTRRCKVEFPKLMDTKTDHDHFLRVTYDGLCESSFCLDLERKLFDSPQSLSRILTTERMIATRERIRFHSTCLSTNSTFLNTECDHRMRNIKLIICEQFSDWRNL